PPHQLLCGKSGGLNAVWLTVPYTSAGERAVAEAFAGVAQVCAGDRVPGAFRSPRAVAGRPRVRLRRAGPGERAGGPAPVRTSAPRDMLESKRLAALPEQRASCDVGGRFFKPSRLQAQTVCKTVLRGRVTRQRGWQGRPRSPCVGRAPRPAS